MLRIAAPHPAARAARAWDFLRGPGLVLAGDAEEAERLYEGLRLLFHETTPVRYLPPWPEVGFEPLAPSPEVAAERIAALDALARGEGVVVAEVAAVLRRTRPARTFREEAFDLAYAAAFSPEEVRRRLVGLGYLATAEVTSPGEFAARGGILDLFPPTEELPVRVAFDEDLVAEIRRYDPATQRSVEEIERVRVPPAREIPLAANVEAAERIEEAVRRTTGVRGNLLRLAALCEAVRTGTYREGVELFLPFLTETATVFELAPQTPLVVVRPNAVLAAAREATEGLEAEVGASDLAFAPEFLWLSPVEVERALGTAALVLETAAPDEATPVEETRPLPPAPADAEVLRVDLARLVREYDRVVVGTAFADRVREALSPGASSVEVRNVPLHQGVGLPALRLALVGDADLFGPRRKRTRGAKAGSAGRARLDWSRLANGDPVVHLQHGVGIYRGIVRIEVAGAARDVVKIEYAGSDVLYLPPTATDRIERWVAPEGTPLRLDSLGGASWAKTRRRVTEEARKTARRLLDLYALRETLSAAPLLPHPEEDAFAASFPYAETPDQAKALEAALAGLAREKPSDHLVVGDVGFGKTEVALRAAFRAARNGRQTAVLAPTTILAEQHFETFRERLAPFGVRVGVLSRLRSKAEVAQTLASLARGECDVVVGTHRLLSKDVRFARLGLVVVDEEQRFGVRHKERLKELRKTAHVLTLTATPIPRTLHLALSGMRDLSVIETPPPGRAPVATVVAAFDEALVRRAIERERARNGGVFYVHNRIETIDRVERFLRGMFPDLALAVVHGKTGENDLARRVAAFAEGEVDLLLSTSIIENGLDIPRANTIVVDRADRFGLAELYQLRGRVGRSDRKAYAYFLYPTDGTMTPAAARRLEKVAEHTRLGAGFSLAMEDLALRGAGEILGTKQSGAYAHVGYDVYVRLLREAVEELRGAGRLRRVDRSGVVVDLAADAFLPEEWLGAKELVPQIYRLIAKADSLAELAGVREALIDRFGGLPEPVENLLRVAELEHLAALDGVSRIVGRDDVVEIEWRKGVPDAARAAAEAAGLPRWIEGTTLRVAVGRTGEPPPFGKVYEIVRDLLRR